MHQYVVLEIDHMNCGKLEQTSSTINVIFLFEVGKRRIPQEFRTVDLQQEIKQSCLSNSLIFLM